MPTVAEDYRKYKEQLKKAYTAPTPKKKLPTDPWGDIPTPKVVTTPTPKFFPPRMSSRDIKPPPAFDYKKIIEELRRRTAYTGYKAPVTTPPWAGPPPYARWGQEPTGKSYTGREYVPRMLGEQKTIAELQEDLRRKRLVGEGGKDFQGAFRNLINTLYGTYTMVGKPLGLPTFTTQPGGKWSPWQGGPAPVTPTPAAAPLEPFEGGFTPAPEDPYEIFAPHTKAYLERGFRPAFIPYGSQEVLGLTDEQMESMGYVRGENGWIMPTYGTPETTGTGAGGYTGAYPAYQPIQINYPGVSSTRAASGRSYGLVNWRV